MYKKHTKCWTFAFQQVSQRYWITTQTLVGVVVSWAVGLGEVEGVGAGVTGGGGCVVAAGEVVRGGGAGVGFAMNKLITI